MVISFLFIINVEIDDLPSPPPSSWPRHDTRNTSANMHESATSPDFDGETILAQLATWTLRYVLIFTRKGYRNYIISDIGRVLDKFCFMLVQYFKLEKLCDSRRTLVPTCFLTMIDHLS